MRRATGGPERLIEGETVMHLRLSRRLRIAAAGTLALTAIVGMALAPSLNRPARAAAAPHMHLTCEDNSYLCTEALDSLNYDGQDRKSTRLNSSHMSISYAVFCLKKKKKR